MLINLDVKYVNNWQVPEVDKHWWTVHESTATGSCARAPSGPVGRRPSSGPKEGQVDIVNRPGQVTWSPRGPRGPRQPMGSQIESHGTPDLNLRSCQKTAKDCTILYITIPYTYYPYPYATICYNYLYDKLWSLESSAIRDLDISWSSEPFSKPSGGLAFSKDSRTSDFVMDSLISLLRIAAACRSDDRIRIARIAFWW